MADMLLLRIFGRLDLDGTHRAVIESNQAPLEALKREGGPPPTMRLSHSGAECGVMLAEYRMGDGDTIHVDRYKQSHLKLKDGDGVWVAEFQPETARAVTLRVPEDFLSRDLVRFIGKTVVADEKLTLFSFAGEARDVQVTACDPQGPVVIDAKTGTSKGFGFVEMALEHEAKIAIEQLHGSKIKKNKIRVKPAT